MLRTAMITGGLGFIGSYVVEEFLSVGWHVLIVDNCSYAANVDFLAEISAKYRNKVSFLNRDICEMTELPECDVIVNLAASSHVGRSIKDASPFFKNNVLGVLNLLEILRTRISNCSDTPLFLHVSTDEVYGEVVDNVLHIESDFLNPRNPYSASKAAADLLINAYHITHGIEYNIIRPSNNFGLRQYPEKLVPICVLNLLRGQKIKLHNLGEPIRVWLHAQDTAKAILKITEDGDRNQIYNCSGDDSLKNREVVLSIIEEYLEEYIDDYEDFDKFIDYGFARVGQDLQYGINDDKLRKLGWVPEKHLFEEIPEIVRYYTNLFMKHYKWVK